MSLTVHVGAHKTATTHLQNSLRAAMPALFAAGLHYSDVAHWRGEPRALTRRLRRLIQRGAHLDAPAQSPFRSPPLPGERAARAAPGRRRAGRPADTATIPRLFDEIVESWPQVLLSEENILGGIRAGLLFGPGDTIYPDAADRVSALGALLRRRPMRLCLSIRDPSGFLTSAFAMQVLGGQELLFEDYLGGFRPEALSWAGLARRLLDVPGVTGVTVWRYEDYPAIRPVLFDRLLPAGMAALVPDPPAVNVSMSQAAFDALRGQAMDDPAADLTGMARRARRAHPRRPGGGGLQVVDAATARRCAAAYAEDCAALAAMPGVELLVPAAAGRG